MASVNCLEEWHAWQPNAEVIAPTNVRFGATADNGGFCLAMVCPLMPQSVHELQRKRRRTLDLRRLAMHTFRRSAIIISFITLALSFPGQAVCGPGHESCEPSVDEARAKIERLLNLAFLTPYSIISLEKLDGRGLETQGRKKYEMRFFAVLNYSGDKLRCRMSLCPELHNYLVKVDEAAKKATIAGWLFFEQAERGWQ